MLRLNQEQSFTFYIVYFLSLLLLFCFTICTLIGWISHSVQRFHANVRKVDFLCVGWKLTQVVKEKLCGLILSKETVGQKLTHKLFLFVYLCRQCIKFNSVQSINQAFTINHTDRLLESCVSLFRTATDGRTNIVGVSSCGHHWNYLLKELFATVKLFHQTNPQHKMNFIQKLQFLKEQTYSIIRRQILFFFSLTFGEAPQPRRFPYAQGQVENRKCPDLL